MLEASNKNSMHMLFECSLSCKLIITGYNEMIKYKTQYQCKWNITGVYVLINQWISCFTAIYGYIQSKK